MKISVIGAGNVGGTLAQRIVEDSLADVVLLDVAEGVAKGKACDLADARQIIGHDKTIFGTRDYKDIAGSNIVVITAGLARQPGMSREDLLKKNIEIAAEVVAGIRVNAKDAVILVVTNPLDVLTNFVVKKGGFAPEKVIGMGGVLDSSRCANIIAEMLSVSVKEVEALVVGAHGQKMLPLLRYCKVSGKPLSEMMSKEKLAEVMAATIDRGAKIVSLLGRGSAYYAPSAAAFSMVRAMVKEENKTVPACVYCRGEYGLKDICIGVPVVLGKNGVSRIVELALTPEEKTELACAAESVRKSLQEIGL